LSKGPWPGPFRPQQSDSRAAYRIDRKVLLVQNGVTTISLAGTAGCAIALTAKPIPALREVDGEEAEAHVFLSPVIIRGKAAGG